jgi:hypothetical protein
MTPSSQGLGPPANPGRFKRSFAHVFDRGGMRRAWLRGRQNVHKRYLIHVAAFNLGILARALFGCDPPREAASAKNAFLFVIQTDAATAIKQRLHHRAANGRKNLNK